MKIQELERRTGLERASIRFYEKEGLLNPKRLENGYREYSEEDAELLKKIKLLRRLGMSVEKVRQLQQGSADLTTVITQQISLHSSQIDDHKRCRAVCEAIREDGAVFSSLDAEHYLKLLREIKINDRVLVTADFQEELPDAVHPWRRYFARWLDYGLWSVLFCFVLFVILRLRPLPGDFLDTLISIGMAAVFIPVEALMLHKFGTTPGKFAMGIRVESVQGCKLSYEEALERSVGVFSLGTGCAIPVVSFVTYIFRYCQLTGRTWRIFARHDEVEGPQDMPWDENTEIIYRDIRFKRGAAIALILILQLGIGMITGFDGIRPKYRGNELTVYEFSQNYNAYMKIFREDAFSYEYLQPDGTWRPIPSNTVYTELNDNRSNHRMIFEYELEGENIRSVFIEHDWNAVRCLYPLTGEPLDLASSVLLAQDGCGYAELKTFLELYWSHAELKNASFVYKNLEVEWVITSELPMEGATIYNETDETAAAQLFFRITIN